jgi:hypothetical protein
VSEKEQSLRSIVAQTKDIVAAIVENNGEITPEIEVALMVIEERTPAKIDAYAVVMERMEMESKYWAEKAEYYKRVSNSCKNVREKLRENIKYAMEQLGTKELMGRDVRFRLSSSTPKLVINEDILDREYLKTEYVTSPDKDRIKEALKAGTDVEGACFLETTSLRQFANAKGNENE